jgi:hypothetical protein
MLPKSYSQKTILFLDHTANKAGQVVFILRTNIKVVKISFNYFLALTRANSFTGFANWSSPEALRAHSTPRTFNKPPADHSLVASVSPTYIKPQLSNDPSGLPDFPLDLTLKSTSSDTITQQSVEVPAGPTQSYEKPEPDNIETPNKSRNSRLAVKIDSVHDTQQTKTLKAGDPNTSAGLPPVRVSKKSHEKGKTSRIGRGNSAKKLLQQSKKKTNK